MKKPLDLDEFDRRVHAALDRNDHGGTAGLKRLIKELWLALHQVISGPHINTGRRG